MSSIALHLRSATEIAEGVAAGRFCAEEVVRAYLDRISLREPEVHAWAFIDPEIALAQARRIDVKPRKGRLAGVPVGVKDIFETFDMPTDMGSPIYRGNRTSRDASCIALARAADAVIMGKTVTCEFAGVTPNITRNPLDTERTPGGSSSRSAAAVADHMVAAALGSQTGGSVIRPSSFCGIVGYKPTYNLVCRSGMQLAAESRDTVGLMARNIEDIDLIASVLMGREGAKPCAWPPRIGVCRTFFWDEASTETRHAVEDAAARLSTMGAQVEDVVLPTAFEDLAEARSVVNPFERARALAHEWNTSPTLISTGLAHQIEEGLRIPLERYRDALAKIAACRSMLPSIFGDLSVLLAPSVAGEAPVGLATTGDPKFQDFWTALHVPTISLPTHRGPNDLPVGIQLIGRIDGDENLIATAQNIFVRLKTPNGRD